MSLVIFEVINKFVNHSDMKIVGNTYFWLLCLSGPRNDFPLAPDFLRAQGEIVARLDTISATLRELVDLFRVWVEAQVQGKE